MAVLLCLAFQGCQTPTRSEVNALVWLNNFPVPQDAVNHCEYGFYRRLNDGNLEFFSICNPNMPKMVSMKDSEYQALLDQYIKKK